MAQDPNGIMQLAGTVRVGGTSIDRSVLSSIHSASRKSGVSFAFMLAKARRESNFQTSATNGASSAQGLYQFTKQTWLEQIKRHGAEHGLGDLANQIHRDRSGRYRVDDPQAAQRILDLREDHGVSSSMAAEYAADNRRYLTRTLGRPVSDTDLYFAHFLGPGGAVEFLSAMDQDPNQDASALLPQAASANHSIFFGASGQGRSLAEVHALVGRNIQASMRRYASAANLPELNGPIPLPPGAKPESINQMAAEAARPENMGVPTKADRLASLPLPPGAKPSQPAEDMGDQRDGAYRMASAEGTPRPMARKPAPENMSDGAPRPPTREQEGTPRILTAEAEGKGSTRWSDQALALSLTQAAPGPILDAPRARAFDAAQTFARIARSGFQWSRDNEPTDGGEGTLLPSAPGLPLRAEQVTPPRPPGSHDTDALAPLRTASLSNAPQVTAANGAASYAVRAVVETFDPDNQLTSVTAPIPRIASAEPQGHPITSDSATSKEPRAEASAERETSRQAAYQTPPSSSDSPLAPPVATQAAVLGWFRRMFG